MQVLETFQPINAVLGKGADVCSRWAG